MLQPEEIQKVTFEQSVFSGYKKEDVDAFLDKVHGEYSRLYKENAELVEKLKVCISKIEEYREDEKFLKSAIVNAQKLNETAMQEIALKKQEVEETARKQADAIVSEAREKAQQLTDESNQKIAEFKEKSTREYAQQQLDQANAFAAKKREYEAKIQEKQAEFESLQQKIDMFKASVLTIFEQQINLLSALPEIEKPASEEPAVESVSVAEPVVEEVVEPVSDEVEVAPVETITEQADEESAEPQPVIEEPEVIEDPAIAEEVAEESNTAEDDTVVEEAADEPAEEATVAEPEEDFEAEQIDIEQLIAVKPSPVEPEAPVLPVVDDNDDAPAEEPEEEFHLFGASPLIFPTDIPDDDEDDKPEAKEKGSRFKKKLKFGVDFDVKKDK